MTWTVTWTGGHGPRAWLKRVLFAEINVICLPSCFCRSPPPSQRASQPECVGTLMFSQVPNSVAESVAAVTRMRRHTRTEQIWKTFALKADGGGSPRLFRACRFSTSHPQHVSHRITDSPWCPASPSGSRLQRYGSRCWFWDSHASVTIQGRLEALNAHSSLVGRGTRHWVMGLSVG